MSTLSKVPHQVWYFVAGFLLVVCFWPVNFEAKLSNKRFQIDQECKKSWVSFLIDFLIDFVDFGRVLAAKLEPSWHQMACRLCGLLVVFVACLKLYVCIPIYIYMYLCIQACCDVDISATVPSGTIVECSKALMGPWDPGIVVLEIPEGFLRGQETNYSGLPGRPAPLLFDDFFDIVSGG